MRTRRAAAVYHNSAFVVHGEHRERKARLDDKMVSDTFLSPVFEDVSTSLFRARHINDSCLAYVYAKRYFLFRLVGDAVASTQPAAMRSFTRLRAWLSVKSLSCAISRSDISPCDRSICSTKLAPL